MGAISLGGGAMLEKGQELVFTLIYRRYEILNWVCAIILPRLVVGVGGGSTIECRDSRFRPKVLLQTRRVTRTFFWGRV